MSKTIKKLICLPDSSEKVIIHKIERRAAVMKDKFIKKLKRSWLALWIAFAAAALSTIGVLAAYTSVSSVKRVVSTQKGAGMLFSSNYLTTDESDLPRTITFSSMETSPCVTVNVCNYPQTMISTIIRYHIHHYS